MMKLISLMMAAGVALGQSAGQIRTAREALDAATMTLGPEHPATAMMLRNLALAFEEAGYYSAAERDAQRSLAILESHFGADDPSLVPALNVLAETYIAQRRYAAGERTARRAVAIGKDAGPHYATALHNLATALAGEGKRQEAERFYNEALAARQAVLPAGHPYVEATRSALSQTKRAGRTATKSALVP